MEIGNVESIYETKFKIRQAEANNCTHVQTYDFKSWCKELDKIAVISGMPDNYTGVTGNESWLDYFTGDYSPAEAFVEDMSYA